MFKNQFQGGPFVEIFSCQGKEPLSKWKLTGSSIQKVYEKEVKSYVFSLEGSSTTTKMQLPRDSKQTLGLVQRYLVVQLTTPAGAALSIELGILDSSNNKRRLLFSTAQKDISITPLHVKLPLLVLRRGVWLNLCLDLMSVVGEAFRGQAFKSLDSVTISASCRVRKIFTMKSQPQDSTDDDDIYGIDPATNSVETDIVPKSCQFPFDVVHQTQVVNMSKLRHVDLKLRSDASRPPSTSEMDFNSSMKSNREDRPTHIAFGTKVPVPHSSQGRKTSARQPKEGSVTSRSARSGSRRTSGTLSGSKTSSPSVAQPDENTPTHQPHPPQQKSADKSRRVVKVRPNSGRKNTEGALDKKKNKESFPDSSRKIDREAQKYDPSRYTSHGKGDSWDNIDHEEMVSGQRTENVELRSSTEVKVTSHFGAERESRTNSESSEKFAVSESDCVSNVAENFGNLGIDGRDKSRSQVKGDKSRIPRKKKKSEKKKVGLMDSLSENEEVQYSLRRIRDSGEVDVHQTDSGVGLTGSRTSVENISSFDEDESNDIRTERIKDASDSSLYTFTSPPRSAPNRQKPERTKGLDQKTLQTKLLQMQETAPTSPRNPPEAEDRLEASLNGGDFTKNAPDESLSDDQYKTVLRNTPSPRPDHSPIPRNGTMDSDLISSQEMEPEPNKQHPVNESDNLKTAQRGSPVLSHSPVLSRSPVRSRSPTLRKSKFDASGKGVQFSGPDDTMPQPVSSEVSPRGMGTLSRLSIQASRVKEIPKTDVRLSEDNEWRNYKSNSSSLASSLEAKMLASLKREQLEELYEDENHPPAENSFELHNYGDDDLSSSSDDTTTTFSTWKPPEINKGNHRIQDEMHFPRNPLAQSNPRDWGSVFSPPIVLPSEKMKDSSFVDQLSPAKEKLSGGGVHQSSKIGDGRPIGVVTGPDVAADDEEELDLLYDPCLNCYFDPATGKYYELA